MTRTFHVYPASGLPIDRVEARHGFASREEAVACALRTETTYQAIYREPCPPHHILTAEDGRVVDRSPA